MRKPYNSIRVFEKAWMEKFTHVHPITPLLVWLPVIAFLFWRSVDVLQLSLSSVVLVAFGGLVSWTLAEYLLHRFLFHIEGETPLAQRLHFLIHGLHHADPVDPTRLVMPPAASIFLGVTLYSLFRYFLGEIWVEPFFAGFLIGYLCYDYIHYSVHHFNPRTPIGRFLKQSHMQHHYVNPNSHWGVSSPFWDYVFGTVEVSKRKSQAVS